MTISFSGLASGLDTSSWVESLVALKQAKIDTLEEEKETVLLSKETLDNIKSFFTSFRSMIEKVTDAQFGVASMDLFAQNLATSSDLDILTASATTEAEEARYNISVDTLATNTQLNSSYSYVTTQTITQTATSDSKLENLGVNAGRIGITVNGVERSVNISDNETIQSFIDKLKEIGVDASFNSTTGVFTVNLDTADINDYDNTGIVNALHLIGVNEGYTSDKLQIEKTETVYESADESSLLNELSSGVKIIGTQNVIVQNTNGENYTIEVDAFTTLGEFLTALEDTGLNASIKNGVVEISGGKITGGTYDAVKALGLSEDPYTAMTTGNPLTETVVEAEIVTLETRLVDDLKVRAGYLEVTDADGSKFYEKIYHGQTLGDLMSDLGNLGINTKLRDDGVLEITGGAFATLSDDRVQELIDNGTIRETDDRYKQGTDLLTCLYGAPVISTDQITVASTYSKTQALTYSVTNTIRAALTTTLENLGLSSDSNAVFTVRGENRTINVTKSMTVEDLMNALQNAGIASVWDTDTSRLTIENATLNGGALADVLNLTQVVSGKYVTSNALYEKVTSTVAASTTSTAAITATTQVVADLSTKFSQIRVTKDNTITVHKSDGTTVNISVSKDSTIDSFFDAIDRYGVQGVISDGIITLTSADGAYVTDASGSNLLTTLGINTESYVQTITVGTSTTGSSFKFTLTQSATGDNTFAEIGSGGNKTWTIRDGATGAQVASGTFSESTTIGQFLDILGQYGFSGSIDGGFVTVSSPQGYYVTGSAADALGLKTYQYTTTVHGTATNTIAATDTFTVDQTRTVTTSGVVTVNASDTIVVDITRTVNTSSSGYVTVTVSDTITVNVTKTIDTDSTGTTVITNSTVVTMTVRQTLTTTITTTSAATQTQSAYTFASKSTTAGELGISGSYTIIGKHTDGTTFSDAINISSSDSIETMLKKLNNAENGVIFDYDESNGCFYVYANYENAMRWGLTYGSASKLRIYTQYGSTGVYAGVSSSGFYTTRTVTTVVNKTSTISTTSTVSVAVTKTITDTFTVALDTTGKATINIQQTLTVSATRTEKVDTTGSTVINVKQTLTIQATSTERVNTTGTVRVTQTVTVTAHQTITVDVTATNTYTANKSSADYNAFSTVNNMDGNTKLAEVGLTDGVINGVHNGEAFSVTINPVETIDGISSRLAAYGIEVSIKNGSMTFKGSKNSYITSASGAAASLGAGSAYTTQTENHNYNTNSNNQGYSTTMNITTDSIFSDMGLTSNGTITIKQDGTIYTVTVKTGDTVDDFLTQLAAYDIKGSVSDGKITLTGTDDSFVMSASNNLTNIIKLKTGEGNSYNSSTYTVKTTLDTKLNQLTDASGSSLGITSGNIYVYQDGTRHLVNINNEDTLQTLAAKLAQYGITMELDSNGKVYLEGNNNSYLTIQGITSGASNILSKLNISNNWDARYDSVSENLKYNVNTNNRIDGSTKLSDLQDKDGNNLNITEGAFYVYNNGVRTTETITSDMTIDDLKALFAKNGLIVDIDQNGSISAGAYNNTYLATSATSGANSNIVSTLFAEWDFVNIYTSNGITIPKDVIKAVTRDTKLADINEGTYVDGCITVVHDGIQTNISLTADDTIGTLIDELALYGFNSVINNSGQLIIKSDGDSTLKEYTGADKASNLLDLLGISSANWVLTNSYSNNDTKTYEVITSHINATDDTLLSELDIIWGDDVLKAQGQLAVTVDGVTHKINITDNETFGSLKEKFAVLGLEATISDGVFMIQSGYKDMNFDMANTTSSIVTNLGLVFHDDLGGYSATDSMSSVEQTTTVVTSHTDSVANYAGYDTKMGLLNISDGTLSIYRNGEKEIGRAHV